MYIRWIKIRRTLIGVQSIRRLVVAGFVLIHVSDMSRNVDAARTYQRTQVVPDFRDVRIESYGARVRIKCVAVLIDLVIENSNGTPERRVPTITVHRLLVSLVCFGVFLL